MLYYSNTNPNGAAIAILKEGKDNTADTVGSDEILVLRNFELIAATGGAVSVSGGNAGYPLIKGTLPTSGGGIANSMITRRGNLATAFTITATAGGQVDFVGEAEIIKVPT